MSEDNYLTHQRGFMSWAFSLDHKRIGLMYMAMVMTRLSPRRDFRDHPAHVPLEQRRADVQFLQGSEPGDVVL